MKRKKKRGKKEVYRVNADTISLNMDEVEANRLGRCAPWEEKIDPRRLRKKGSLTCR